MYKQNLRLPIGPNKIVNLFSCLIVFKIRLKKHEKVDRPWDPETFYIRRFKMM